MKLWNTYKRTINHNCNPTPVETEETVSYWRNTLFSTTMMFLLPLCLIALLPSLLLITYENKEFITLLHFTTIGLMCFIAFAPGVKVTTRKLIFSFTIFLFAIVLNILTSPSSGSVLVYFLAACIYSIIIFDNKYAFWWSHIVLFISVLFGFAIHFNLTDFSHNVDMSSVNEWVAVSANLVFLCYLSSALIPKIFSGIENHLQEQIKLESELEKSKMALLTKNEELEQFAYIASHDLKAPVRNIKGLLDIIRKNEDQIEDEIKQKYFDVIISASDEMSMMIDNLLEYSRTGESNEELQTINLPGFYEDVINVFRNDLKNIPHTIHTDFAVKELPVYPILFKRLLNNLIGNSIKYRRDVELELSIKNRADTDCVQFEISDNGIGIPENQKENIFKMFKSLIPDKESNGIGLPVCKKIVEMHGGRIRVESTEGEGSAFYFTIPNSK